MNIILLLPLIVMNNHFSIPGISLPEWLTSILTMFTVIFFVFDWYFITVFQKLIHFFRLFCIFTVDIIFIHYFLQFNESVGCSWYFKPMDILDSEITAIMTKKDTMAVCRIIKMQIFYRTKKLPFFLQTIPNSISRIIF